jgi:hypothetical protein
MSATMRAVVLDAPGPPAALRTGTLSDEWTVPDVNPIEYLPRGVRLTAYAATRTTCPPRSSSRFSTTSRPDG